MGDRYRSVGRFAGKLVKVGLLLGLIALATGLVKYASAADRATAPAGGNFSVGQGSVRSPGAYDAAGRKVDNKDVPSTTWVTGDVAVANGTFSTQWSYKIYSNNGTFKEQIYDGLPSSRHTGCAFDSNGNLFTTSLDNNKVVKFDGSGTHGISQTIDTSVPSGAHNPETVIFAANGDFYVGNSNVTSSGIHNLQRYNSSGVWQQSYVPVRQTTGVDWIDLAADQHTILYSSEGSKIMRYDVSGAGTQLADFNADGSDYTALRIQPGTNNVFAANYSNVRRLSSTGAQLQSYTIPNSSWLFAFNLDPNGTSFWTGDLNYGKFYRLNINTGNIELGPIDPGVASIAGICVKGEITASQPTITPGPSTTQAVPTVTNQIATSTRPALTSTPTPTNTPTRTVAAGSTTPRPTITAASTATVCADTTPLTEGFESATLGAFYSSGAPAWNPATGDAHSGTYSAFVSGSSQVAQSLLQLSGSNSISIPSSARAATLTFWHDYSFELDFDGGVLELSTDGGQSWSDAGPNITSGAYNGTLDTRYGNPLAGRQAWTGASSGYAPVVVNLLPYAGHSLLLRMHGGWDSSNGGGGWTVDDVNVTVQNCSGAPPNGCQLPFGDVPQGSTFYPYIHCLACYGVVNGFSDGTYRPSTPVSRGQLAKIISNSADFSETPAGQTFADVAPGSPFWQYVERLVIHNAIGGYTCGGAGEPCDSNNRPYFRPGSTATRGQISKIVVSAAGILDPVPSTQQTFTDVSPGSTFWLYVERLYARGVLGGYQCGGVNPYNGQSEPCDAQNRPYFRPGNPTTRGQMAKIAGNTFFPGCYIPFK